MQFIWVLLIFSSPLLAFEYFGGQIDYWNQHSHESTRPRASKPREIPKKEAFHWDKYLDPKHEEFFTEGNHKPPAPFMELARNPTDENIKRWFQLIETKNKLMKKLHTHLANYVSKQGSKLKAREKQLIEEKLQEINARSEDVKRFRFRLYFESSCPHCKNMLVTAKELEQRGYYIEIRQIDHQKPTFPVPFPITYASSKELRERKINSWPVLFVADTKKQLVYRINGYHSTSSLLSVLSKK